MKGAVLNVVCAFILMLIQSNFGSAFGIEFTCQFAIAAVVIVNALSVPTITAVISILILGLLGDLMMSGPAGLFAFILIVVYLGVRFVMTRFRSDRVVSTMIYSAIACLIFELLLAIAYCLLYQTSIYWGLFVRTFFIDVILTALFTPLMITLVRVIENATSRRRSSTIT